MTDEQFFQIVGQLALITMVLFLFFYELTHPEIKVLKFQRFDSLLKKPVKTGDIKLKKFYFKHLFKQVIIIKLNTTQKRLYIKVPFTKRYFKLTHKIKCTSNIIKKAPLKKL